MSDKKIKVRFIEDAYVDGSHDFHKGRSYTLSTGSAHRWLKRGKAVLDVEAGESDEVVEAELDASLAENLQNDGKAEESEVAQALEHVSEVKETSGAKKKKR